MQVVSFVRGSGSGRRSPSPSLNSSSAENLSSATMSHASSITSLYTPASAHSNSELEAIPEAPEVVPISAAAAAQVQAGGRATSLSPHEPPASATAAAGLSPRGARSPARFVSRIRNSMTYNRSHSAELVLGTPPSV